MPSISPAALRVLRAAIEGTPFRPVACQSSRILSRGHIVRYPLQRQQRPYSAAASQHSTPPTRPPDEHFDHLLQNPPKTYYDFFPSLSITGPPPDGPFTIDQAALKRDFIRLQAVAHPDRHPAERRRAAERLSAQINTAFKTLSSPLRRAEYILDLRGARDSADEERVVGDGEGDQETLMEVMEAQQEAEEAADDEEMIREMRRQNDTRMGEVIGQLDDAFEKDDLVRAKKEAVKLSYWDGLEERLRYGSVMH
ncbi:Co-chaperone Hsc20 [Microthyrium microscopicum]|uniref:Co-chaperone Hsc20 n=1 Tax=Microthyrium microscopicum TaxID=703497 RepID=A0A6A6URZ0_9PEZI|nr:Co-chaperone Hsc20 [Microthyrium microscopicum]